MSKTKIYNLKGVKLIRYNPYIHKINRFNKGEFIMRNIGTDTILNFAGFAAAGVAAYAAFDSKWKITAIAAGAGLLCLYGSVQLLKDKLAENKAEEERDQMWRENDNIHERINKVESRIDTCVAARDHSDDLRGIYDSIEEIKRDNRADVDAIYRYIDVKADEINRTIEGIDCAYTGTACGSKRK